LRIEIASYRRSSVLKRATLAELARGNCPKDAITVWVANEQELVRYKEEDLGVRLKVGQVGVTHQKRLIHRDTTDKENVLHLDDDCYQFQHTMDGKRLEPLPNGLLMQTFDWAFKQMRQTKSGVWGLCPTQNAFYMDQTASVGNYFICGITCGARGGETCFVDQPRTIDSIEDYEVTARAIRKYGYTLRINWLTVKTEYHASGGILANYAEDKKARYAAKEPAIRQLVSASGGLCREHRKADGELNVRFRPNQVAKLDRPTFL
jgi:hypothetical protein